MTTSAETDAAHRTRLLFGELTLLLSAAARGRLRRRGAPRQMLLGTLVPGLAFLVATRRFNADGDGLNQSAWQSLGGALTVLPFVAASWSTGGTRLDTVGAAGRLTCIAVVVCGAVGSVLFNRGIAHVPAAQAGQLANITPVTGTVTAVGFLGDRPSLPQLAGGAAILVALAWLLHSPPNRPDVPEPKSHAPELAGRLEECR
jgi:drug/metabolite transporter (DMT)-like permease